MLKWQMKLKLYVQKRAAANRVSMLGIMFFRPPFCFLLSSVVMQSILSFQGRPKGVTPKYSLKPLVPRLSELLGVDVCYKRINHIYYSAILLTTNW
jgi:hypothetical protein